MTKHVDVAYLWKVRIHGSLLEDWLCLIGNDFVRLQLSGCLAYISSYL